MTKPVKFATTPAEQQLAERFKNVNSSLAGDDWASKLRLGAMTRFEMLGLPHRRIEAWKYTDLRNKLSEISPPVLAPVETIDETSLSEALGADLEALQCYRLVFVDGHFDAARSDMAALARHIDVASLKDLLSAPPQWLMEQLGKVNPPDEEEAVIALNTAFMSDGAILRISEGVKLDKPVHIIHVNRAAHSIAMCNMILVGEGADVTLLESHVHSSAASGEHNSVTELSLGANARVRHIKFQNESGEALHLSSWMVRIGEGSDYRAFQFSVGAKISRNQIFVKFAGEGAYADISGALMLWRSQHCDTTLIVDHGVPSCISRETFKAVLDDNSRGIFQGKLVVRPHAQKSDAKQMARALLLSDRAEFDAKPELVIFADDVMCGHGATSGQIDEDLLFYLRSRGISEDRARTLLILAFVGEALELVEEEEIRKILNNIAGNWLGCG